MRVVIFQTFFLGCRITHIYCDNHPQVNGKANFLAVAPN